MNLTRAQVENVRDTTAADSLMHKLAEDWLAMEAERPKPGEWRAGDPVWPPPERN